MGKRRRARELALQYLYQWDFHGPKDEDPAKNFWETRNDPEKVRLFGDEIVEGVKQNQEKIDGLIEANSKHWKIYRMSRIDRNILRIAIYEFLFCDDIPPKVSIDEAIEIGKKFGTTESGAFINGVLDQVCKRIGKISSKPEAETGDDVSPGNHDPG